MLTELTDVDQTASDGRRRWFAGESVELVVWEDGDGVRGYQLRYRRRAGTAADDVFEWRRGGRLSHYLLDDGESRAARAKAAPVLRPAGSGPLDEARAAFRAESEGIEPALRTVVEETLHPD